MNMVITSECEKCRYGVIDDKNKSRIKVYCSLKNKTYYFGQCIPCDNKEVKKMKTMTIKFKKTNINAVVPTKGSEYSAGYDLYTCIDKPIFINPHETVMIGTGLSIELPDGTFGAIVARSSVALERGLAPANKIGICDSDYRGEYMIALHNHSNTTQWVNPGERIAQLIVIPYINAEFVEAKELTVTERKNGGFGSTGKYL